MGVLREFRKRWFVTTICAAAGMFFLVALVYSSLTYVRVMDARTGVELRDAVESTELLANGSLKVGLTIELYNPSAFNLNINSISWSIRIDNATTTPLYIPVATDYTSAAAGIVARPHTALVLVYEGIVSDPAKLAAIKGFINYSAGLGENYTIETVPYLHDFRVVAWVDSFDHDYQYYREFYLNDMVRIERSYYGGEYR